jgi:malate dehydrogenase
VASLVATIVAGGGRPTVASTLLDGEYEVSDVALGVPVQLGSDGVERILEWELDADERSALRYSAR